MIEVEVRFGQLTRSKRAGMASRTAMFRLREAVAAWRYARAARKLYGREAVTVRWWT